MDQDVTRDVTRDVVLDVDLPPGDYARVEVRRIRMGPNVAPGTHTHNGPVVGSIESGSVLFQVEDGPSTVLRAGDTFHEPADTVITHFDALEDGVVFLAYFPLLSGQEGELRLL